MKRKRKRHAIVAKERPAQERLSQPCGEGGNPPPSTQPASSITVQHGRLSFRTAKALAIIDLAYASPHLNLEKISKEVGVTKSHFCRLFRRDLGIGFPEYLRLFRGQHAEALLRDSVLSVKEIAAAVGFDYVAQLDRAFRSLHGCTPTAYRVHLACASPRRNAPQPITSTSPQRNLR